MAETLDIAALRAETPGCAHKVHFNNAGAALMPRPVIDALKAHIDLEAEIGGYEAAAIRAADCDAVYASVARLIGARPREIALLENATVAWQLAFYALQFAEGDRILTSRAEYAANYVAFLQMAQRTGCVIEVIPDDAYGASDPAALEAMIDARAKLIAITWVPTNGGLINPAAEIGRIARAHGITYLLDACQAVGQMPVDVEALGCDFLSATGRKFLRGPRGTGFLYVRETLLETIEPPVIDHFAAPWVNAESFELRSDARRFETWEKSYALTLGLGAAADYALALGSETIMARSFALANQLRQKLAAVPHVKVHDLVQERCAIVSFTHAKIAARDLAGELRQRGINISASSPSSTLLDAMARDLPELARASVHYYNTEDEIESFIRALVASA